MHIKNLCTRDSDLHIQVLITRIRSLSSSLSVAGILTLWLLKETGLGDIGFGGCLAPESARYKTKK